MEGRKFLAVLRCETVAHHGIVAQERQSRCGLDGDRCTLPLEQFWKLALEESGEVTKLWPGHRVHVAGNCAEALGVDLDDARIEQLLVRSGDRFRAFE